MKEKKEIPYNVQDTVLTSSEVDLPKVDTDSIINLSTLEAPYKKEIIEGLNKSVIGQEKAKEEIATFIANALVKVGHTKGTLGNIFFHGPTGVGKTEIARGLSKFFFGNEHGFIKIDCAEFSDSHTKNRFFGSPPSYVGYGDSTVFDSKTFYNSYDIAKKEGKLNPILNKLGAFNIILFDEIEKAHNDVIQSLLGILDDGILQLADAKKPPINFGNSIVIFTSNIGEKEIQETQNEHSVGFFRDKKKKDKENNRKSVFEQALKSKFSPEFLGRIDSFVEFQKLNKDELKQIIDLNITKFETNLNKFYKLYPDINITLDKSVYDYIINHGYDEDKGARNLYKTYNREVESKISVLCSMPNFQKYENKKGTIKLDLYEENGNLFAKELFNQSSVKEDNDISKKSVNIENDFNPDKTVIYRIGGVNNMNISLSSNDVYYFSLMKKGEISYILNGKFLNKKFNDYGDFYGDFNGVNLQGNLMEKLNIKPIIIERLINNFTFRYSKDYNEKELIDLEEFKNELFIFLYEFFFPISQELNFDIQEFMQEIIPIVAKKFSKI